MVTTTGGTKHAAKAAKSTPRKAAAKRSQPVRYKATNDGSCTCVFGGGLGQLDGRDVLGGRRASLAGRQLVAAVLGAGGVREGILGGVGVRQHHHFAVLTALWWSHTHTHVTSHCCLVGGAGHTDSRGQPHQPSLPRGYLGTSSRR